LAAEVDWSHLAPAADVVGDDDAETDAIHDLVDQAVAYLGLQSWCRSVDAVHIGLVVGGIVLVAYVAITAAVDDPEIPPAVWVVVGDLPPAYIHPDYAADAREVLRAYRAEMGEWVRRVRDDESIDDSVIPVDVDPTSEAADALAARLDLIKRDILDVPPEETPGFITVS
jgi:hypothetical protein